MLCMIGLKKDRKKRDCLLAAGGVGVGSSVGGAEGLATVWKQKSSEI